MSRIGRYRGGHRDVEASLKDAKAVELRLQGLTLQAIADQLGWKNKSSAHEAIGRALADTLCPPADALRALEAERLDDLTRRAYDVLTADHVYVQHGKIVRDEYGQPIKDHGPALAAIDRIVQISNARRKLLGLDVPVRTDVTVHQVDAQDLELMAILDAARARNAERLAQVEASIPGEIIREDQA